MPLLESKCTPHHVPLGPAVAIGHLLASMLHKPLVREAPTVAIIAKQAGKTVGVGGVVDAAWYGLPGVHAMACCPFLTPNNMQLYFIRKRFCSENNVNINVNAIFHEC